MNKILMYDKYDETYRKVIDVKELKEYILKRIEELEAELKKEEEKNKEYKDMIIRHKKQLKQAGIYGYDYDLEILEEE